MINPKRAEATIRRRRVRLPTIRRKRSTTSRSGPRGSSLEDKRSAKVRLMNETMAKPTLNTPPRSTLALIPVQKTEA